MKILKITDWTQDLHFSKDCFYLEVTENRSNRSLTMKGHFSYITRHEHKAVLAFVQQFSNGRPNTSVNFFASCS